MKIREGLAFDDILLVPRSSKVLPYDVERVSKVTKPIGLNESHTHNVTFTKDSSNYRNV